jgi:hypothetical protein
MPAAVSVIGSVPIVGGTVVRALTVDDNGGIAVLRDGTLFGLDPIGRAESVVSDAPRSVASVVRVAGRDVVDFGIHDRAHLACVELHERSAVRLAEQGHCAQRQRHERQPRTDRLGDHCAPPNRRSMAVAP